MAIEFTPTNSVILGALFVPAGVLMVGTGTVSYVSVMFCLIGAVSLIGGIVRLARGDVDVATEKVQRRRRERFGRKP